MLRKTTISKVLMTLGLSLCLSQWVMATTPTIKLEEIAIPQPTAGNKLSTKRTTTRLTQSHYREIVLDDAFSEKIFNRYINSLDYNHTLFLQSDIDALRKKYAHVLDDELNEGKLEAAFAIYQFYVKRRYERYRYALSLLDNEPDLTTDEVIEVDRKQFPWPTTVEEAEELWKARVKNDIINMFLKDKNWEETQKRLTKRYNLMIRRLTQTRSDDITQIYLNAFALEIDPHTSYLNPRSAKSFTEGINLSLEGIGATLYSEDDEIIIKSLVPGAPAELSKQLKPEDRIIGVGQETGEIEEVIGWRLDDVVDKIKGKKGSKVRLEVEPEKGGKSHIVTLVRDKIRIEDRAAKLTINTIEKFKIASIKIPSFYLGLTDDVRKLISELEEKQAQALIIDLRDDGGGALSEAINLSGLFISDGPIVQVSDSTKRIRIYEDPDTALVYDGPLIVMINRFSASASEIFAGAMKDYDRALIVGQRTFGKGTVQQSRSLNFIYDFDKTPLGFLQYTIQQFYRINGSSTQIKGVKPHIAFPDIINTEKFGEDQEDNALPWRKIASAIYSVVGNASQLAKQLEKQHLERIEHDPEFIALKEELAINKKRYDEKYWSLNLVKRQQENREDEAWQLKKLNERFAREGKMPLAKLDDLPKDYEAPDFYLQETEKIAIDYLQLLKPNP